MDWFERTLRRDFALHGHSIAEWAHLDLPAYHPELHRDDSDLVFPISAWMRRIWEASLTPIEVALA